MLIFIISEMRVVPIIDLSKRDAVIDFEKYSINYLREIKQILLLLTNKTPKICLVYFNKLWIYIFAGVMH